MCGLGDVHASDDMCMCVRPRLLVWVDVPLMILAEIRFSKPKNNYTCVYVCEHTYIYVCVYIYMG